MSRVRPHVQRSAPPGLPAHKSYKSALVMIPPESQISYVEDIRRRNDRRFHRWMPHITLVFPFVPAEFDLEREEVLRMVEETIAAFPTFDVAFESFGTFNHSKTNHTLYLAPDTTSTIHLKALVEKLALELPQYDDVRRDKIFTPHLSLGQFRSISDLDIVKTQNHDLLNSVARVKFPASHIAWVTRIGFKDRMQIQKLFPFSTSFET